MVMSRDYKHIGLLNMSTKNPEFCLENISSVSTFCRCRISLLPGDYAYGTSTPNIRRISSKETWFLSCHLALLSTFLLSMLYFLVILKLSELLESRWNISSLLIVVCGSWPNDCMAIVKKIPVSLLKKYLIDVTYALIVVIAWT